ncbi:CBS domain-containing protein [candidate division WOR-3 bacterium]|nr:CBS domain-containing protein [candidate division WOR-3 bacterium]
MDGKTTRRKKIIEFIRELIKNRKENKQKEAETIIEQGKESGIISEAEADILKGVIYLTSTRVEEIMVPRVETVFLPATAIVEEIIENYTLHRFGKIPLYGNNIDDVVGILKVKDVIPFLHEIMEVPYKAIDFALLPHFIPESKTVLETIKDLQERHLSIAMVVDEYGGVCGIVTLEDLIEEIIGEIEDSREGEEDDYIEQEDGWYLVNARMEFSDFNELLGLNLESEDYNTVGGFVLDNQEKIPKKGDEFSAHGLDFEVVEATRQKIIKLRVRKK